MAAWTFISYLEKLESNNSSLKSRFCKLAVIDNTQDLTELSESFVADVESPFAVFQKDIISQLNESSPPTSGGPSDSESRRGVAGAAASSIKKKIGLDKLPKFKGEEISSPYVNFPVWKKQWEIEIVDYPEPRRSPQRKSR